MRKLLAVILTFVILCMLVGCDSSDYKKAVSLYENGEYLEAMKMFEALEDYEDSRDLLAKCRFNYAKELLANNDYANARGEFEKLEPSEEVDQYLRLSAWGLVRDYLNEEGPIEEKDSQYDVEESTQVESVCVIDKRGKSVIVNIQSSEVISYPILSAKQTTITNTSVSFDGTQLQAELEAKADITFKGTKGSSTFHNVGTCIWDIVSYEIDAPVEWEEYIYIDTNGAMDDTRNAPAFDRRVSMQRSIITACLEKMLEDADLGITMADLGFANY